MENIQLVGNGKSKRQNKTMAFWLSQEHAWCKPV